MSGSRGSIFENQTSSENESDRHVPSKQQRSASSQIEHLTVRSPDESHSPTVKKKKLTGLSVSTSQLYNTELDELTVTDGASNRNPSISSDKDAITPKQSDLKSIHLSPPALLNSTGSSMSVNSSLNGKEDSLDKYTDNQSVSDVLPAVTPGSTSLESSLYPDNLSRSSESGKSIDLTVLRTPESAASKSNVSKSDKIHSSEKKEKKKSSWYNMINPTYKSRSEDFKRLFKDLPESERLIVDYSCALQKDILVQGRLYISENYICFYAKIFGWETFVTIRCKDVTSVTKEKTARLIPNAIQITSDTEKHFFTSFGSRDKTFVMLFRIWQNALLGQPMSSQKIWKYIHHCYGVELGLTSDDDDYVAPAILEDEAKSSKLSEQGIQYSEKLESAAFQESASEHQLEEEHSESANDLNGFDHQSMEDIAEESPQKMVDESKSIITVQKPSEYPTDLSDTTESDDNMEEELEVKCPCENHEGKEVLNTVFPMTVDQIFSLLFTGSKFYYDLLATRKTYDIMESPWTQCPEFDVKMRQVSYTLTLNHSMAKTTQTTETQRLLKHSKPGHIYTVDCDVVNTGIPYSDAFTVKSVYCLTRVAKKECRLRISGCVHYKKSVWGLVKSLIGKSAMQGLADFATDLETALLREAENSSQQGLAKKSRRRKRMKFDPIKCEALKDTPRNLQRQATIRKIGPSLSGLDLGMLGSTPEAVVRVILITLVILLFLNMLLFYKLWSLEDQSVKQMSPVWEYSDSQTALTKEDYLHLLHKQELLHRAETERWKDALNEVIKLIHLIEKSMSDLKSSIDTYNSASIFKTLALRMSQMSEESTKSNVESPTEST